MYYSIYPRLRVIFTYFPERKDIQGLVEAENSRTFLNNLKNLKLINRFPLHEESLEKYLGEQVYQFSLKMKNQLHGAPQEFFTDYMRIYELEDIKNALYGHRGRYKLFKEENYSLEEIGEYLENTPWHSAWKTGFSRFTNSGKIIDIEFLLESRYYSFLLDSIDNLYWSDRRDTSHFLANWVDLVNQSWYYRLHSNFNLEDFEIKQYLITHDLIEKDVQSLNGIDYQTFQEKFYTLCYKSFKEKMYTMAALLSFLNIFKMTTGRILSIYKGLQYNLKKDTIYSAIGER
ncbi:MAG TPA: V-type ATPase subunit [bacterium]|nr:V-type ATPase subunit [bacterium]